MGVAIYCGSVTLLDEIQPDSTNKLSDLGACCYTSNTLDEEKKNEDIPQNRILDTQCDIKPKDINTNNNDNEDKMKYENINQTKLKNNCPSSCTNEEAGIFRLDDISFENDNDTEEEHVRCSNVVCVEGEQNQELKDDESNLSSSIKSGDKEQEITTEILDKNDWELEDENSNKECAGRDNEISIEVKETLNVIHKYQDGKDKVIEEKISNERWVPSPVDQNNAIDLSSSETDTKSYTVNDKIERK